MSTLREWIWLNECIGYLSISNVLDRFYEPKNVMLASEQELLNVLKPEEVQKILAKDFTRADEILNTCFDQEIRVIAINDSEYPKNLKNIFNPPLCLYIKGRLPNLDNVPVITVVGTRDATNYGQTVTKNIVKNLASSGAIIVSGMAMGIDTIANKQALYAGKPTIAVLGCSVDVKYPYENRFLHDDIRATGAIISEFPPTTRPFPKNFPQRNRILSGIADLVLVVEAPLRSGSLITAEYALEQGKEVFAVPGNIDSVNSKGCNMLIKNGAKIAMSALDIIEEFADIFDNIRDVVEFEKIVLSDENETSDENKAEKLKSKKSIKAKKEVLVEANKKTSHVRQNMTKNESIIYGIIKDGYDTADSILAHTDLSTPIVMSTLTILEIYGDIYVKDNKFKIKEN